MDGRIYVRALCRRSSSFCISFSLFLSSVCNAGGLKNKTKRRSRSRNVRYATGINVMSLSVVAHIWMQQLLPLLPLVITVFVHFFLFFSIYKFKFKKLSRRYQSWNQSNARSGRVGCFLLYNIDLLTDMARRKERRERKRETPGHLSSGLIGSWNLIETQSRSPSCVSFI